MRIFIIKVEPSTSNPRNISHTQFTIEDSTFQNTENQSQTLAVPTLNMIQDILGQSSQRKPRSLNNGANNKTINKSGRKHRSTGGHHLISISS